MSLNENATAHRKAKKTLAFEYEFTLLAFAVVNVVNPPSHKYSANHLICMTIPLMYGVTYLLMTVANSKLYSIFQATDYYTLKVFDPVKITSCYFKGNLTLLLSDKKVMKALKLKFIYFGVIMQTKNNDHQIKMKQTKPLHAEQI